MREDKGFFARLFTRGTPECAVLCALLGVLTEIGRASCRERV